MTAHNCSSKGLDALFETPEVEGTQVVHKHKSRQNIYTHKIIQKNKICHLSTVAQILIGLNNKTQIHKD